MKKIISFEKKLDFKSMIGEVSAISLDHTLKFTSENAVEGDFLIEGKYKLTEASVLEEEFNYRLPVDILLNEMLELETTKIDIDDFYYEIEHESTLVCHIDVKIEGVEKIEELPKEEQEKVERTTLEEINEEKEESKEISKEDEKILKEEITDNLNDEELRECDGDPMEEKELDYEAVKEEIEEKRDDNMNIESKEENSNEVGSLFSSFKESDETFASYSVYIIRENESIQSLIEKYKTTKEELENYNDLSSVSIGSKIIIPTANE